MIYVSKICGLFPSQTRPSIQYFYALGGRLYFILVSEYSMQYFNSIIISFVLDIYLMFSFQSNGDIYRFEYLSLISFFVLNIRTLIIHLFYFIISTCLSKGKGPNGNPPCVSLLPSTFAPSNPHPRLLTHFECFSTAHC